MFHLCWHTGIQTVEDKDLIFCSSNGADCEPVVVTIMQDKTKVHLTSLYASNARTRVHSRGEQILMGGSVFFR